MNDVVADLAGLFDAVSVQFDTVSDRLRVSGDHRKSATVADAGVQCCVSRKRKLQETSNPFGLR